LGNNAEGTHLVGITHKIGPLHRPHSSILHLVLLKLPLEIQVPVVMYDPLVPLLLIQAER
jgi:hypothetical protein